MLFTLELSERLKDKEITVNAADPGIVSTDIITMHQWFDPLTDILFRPFIRTPRQGADTAIGLLLNAKEAGVTGQLYASSHRKCCLRNISGINRKNSFGRKRNIYCNVG